MTHLRRRRVLMLLLAAAIAPGAVAANATGPSAAEAAKIEYLIRSVETLDARFVRNGRTYGPGEAAEHLRLKLKNAGGRVKTADEFIRGLGSRSSLSGRPYRIRFADGREITSEQYLRERLAAYRP